MEWMESWEHGSQRMDFSPKKEEFVVQIKNNWNTTCITNTNQPCFNLKQVLQNMVNKKYICHASGNQDFPFQNGHHLYFIIQCGTNAGYNKLLDVRLRYAVFLNGLLTPTNLLPKMCFFFLLLVSHMKMPLQRNTPVAWPFFVITL